jgi:hypothetical protein
MTVYLTKAFARFARKSGLTEGQLVRTAREVMAGRHDVDLGGGVFKQRVAREGGGKSAGFRTIILFRVDGHCIFAHGFAKNATANVSANELKASRNFPKSCSAYPRRSSGRRKPPAN